MKFGKMYFSSADQLTSELEKLSLRKEEESTKVNNIQKWLLISGESDEGPEETCNGWIKPDIVFFGEQLPKRFSMVSLNIRIPIFACSFRR